MDRSPEVRTLRRVLGLLHRNQAPAAARQLRDAIAGTATESPWYPVLVGGAELLDQNAAPAATHRITEALIQRRTPCQD